MAIYPLKDLWRAIFTFLGRQEKSIYEVAPVIAEAPKRITVDPGHEAIISATVRGFPEPAIAWSKDDESIVSGDKCQVPTSANRTAFFKLFILPLWNRNSFVRLA